MKVEGDQRAPAGPLHETSVIDPAVISFIATWRYDPIRKPNSLCETGEHRVGSGRYNYPNLDGIRVTFSTTVLHNATCHPDLLSGHDRNVFAFAAAHMPRSPEVVINKSPRVNTPGPAARIDIAPTVQSVAERFKRGAQVRALFAGLFSQNKPLKRGDLTLADEEIASGFASIEKLIHDDIGLVQEICHRYGISRSLAMAERRVQAHAIAINLLKHAAEQAHLEAAALRAEEEREIAEGNRLAAQIGRETKRRIAEERHSADVRQEKIDSFFTKTLFPFTANSIRWVYRSAATVIGAGIGYTFIAFETIGSTIIDTASRHPLLIAPTVGTLAGFGSGMFVPLLAAQKFDLMLSVQSGGYVAIIGCASGLLVDIGVAYMRRRMGR